MITETIEDYLLITDTSKTTGGKFTHYVFTLSVPTKSIPDRMKRSFERLLLAYPHFIYNLKNGGTLTFRGLGVEEQEYAIARFLQYIADTNKGFIPHVIMAIEEEISKNAFLLTNVKEWKNL